MLDPTDRLEPAHRQVLHAEGAGEGTVDSLLDQRAFPRARDAGYAGERAQRDLHGDVLEIVLRRPDQPERAPRALTAPARHLDRFLTAEIAGGQRGRMGQELRVP